jgi:endonuclease I
LLKEEYTNLKINHNNLILSHEFLSNEPHDATNNVVKIDIAASCDDLIVESTEQGSSSKGKKVVEYDNYDDYVKLKNENEKLKKDLEKLLLIFVNAHRKGSTSARISVSISPGRYFQSIIFVYLQGESVR